MKKSLFHSLSTVSLALACVSLLVVSTGRAQVPRTISYQGYLTDDAAQPLTGPVGIVFRLYAELEGGTAVWTETHGAVELEEGRFTVALGSATALELDFATPMFLELEVGGELLVPRLPLRSVPYAIRAATVADGAVVSATLAPGAVTKDKLAAEVAGTGLAQSADGSLRIALAGVDGAMLAEGAVTDSHVAADAAISPSKIAGTAATLGGTETLTNKTLTNPAIQVLDTSFVIADATDESYRVRLELTPGVRASRVSRVLNVPDRDGTLALQSDVTDAIGALAPVASTGDYADLGGIPALTPVATSGDFADLANLPGIFTRVSVIPGGSDPTPPDVEAVGQDDTLTLEALGPIALSTAGPRATNTRVTIGLRTGSGLVVDGDSTLGVAVDGITIGMDEGDNLQVTNVPVGLVAGLATVATSGDYADLGGRPTLATVASSGSFADLIDVPPFAQLDAPNSFTSANAITLVPTDLPTDTPLLEVAGVLPARPLAGISLFCVDTEGDVSANSYAGNGAGLTDLDANAIATGTLALARLPAIPAASVTGLAGIATSGSFAELADVPDFARRDEENAFTASTRAISLEPADTSPDTPILQLLDGVAIRGRIGEQLFVVDTDGDLAATSVTAGTLAGNGADLTDLNADNITTGTLAVERLPADIPGTLLAYETIGSDRILDGTITDLDISATAAIAFSKLDIRAGDIGTELLASNSFSLQLGTFLLSPTSTVGLGDTLQLSIDTYSLADALAGTGLSASLGQLSVDNAVVGPAMAASLPGKGLRHDAGDDTIAVNVGEGLAIDGANAIVPNVDNETIEVADGQLAVKGVAGAPIVLQTAVPGAPKHGSIIFLDGALQVFNDPDGDGGDPGEWIRIGTYQ